MADENFYPVVSWNQICARNPAAAAIRERVLAALKLPEGDDACEDKIWRLELAFDREDTETCLALLRELGA